MLFSYKKTQHWKSIDDLPDIRFAKQVKDPALITKKLVSACNEHNNDSQIPIGTEIICLELTFHSELQSNPIEQPLESLIRKLDGFARHNYDMLVCDGNLSPKSLHVVHVYIRKTSVVPLKIIDVFFRFAYLSLSIEEARDKMVRFYQYDNVEIEQLYQP